MRKVNVLLGVLAGVSVFWSEFTESMRPKDDSLMAVMARDTSGVAVDYQTTVKRNVRMGQSHRRKPTRLMGQKCNDSSLRGSTTFKGVGDPQNKYKIDKSASASKKEELKEMIIEKKELLSKVEDVISSQPQPGNEQERKMAENLSRRAEWMRECFDPYYEDMTPGLHALEVKMREFQEKFVEEDNLGDQVVMESFNEMNGFFESLLKNEAEKKSLAAVVQYQNFGETCDVIIKDKLKGDGNIGEENSAKKIIETKLGEIHKGLSDNPYFLESFSEYLRWKHFVKNLSHESSEMLYALYMVMNEIKEGKSDIKCPGDLLNLFEWSRSQNLDYRVLWAFKRLSNLTSETTD